MKRLTNSYTRSVENKTVVADEKQGYGHDLVVGHTTYIADPEVRRAITRLSIINVIS